MRLGRKATDQVNNLRAGLPKRGVVDLQGVGSQVEELRPYAEDPVFWESSPILALPWEFCPGLFLWRVFWRLQKPLGH